MESKIELIRSQEYVEIKTDDGEFFRFELKPAIIKFEGLFYWRLPEWAMINNTHFWIPCLKKGDIIIYDDEKAEVTNACNPWDETNTTFVWALNYGCRVKIDSNGCNDIMGFVQHMSEINGLKTYDTEQIDIAGGGELKKWIDSFVVPEEEKNNPKPEKITSDEKDQLELF